METYEGQGPESNWIMAVPGPEPLTDFRVSYINPWLLQNGPVMGAGENWYNENSQLGSLRDQFIDKIKAHEKDGRAKTSRSGHWQALQAYMDYSKPLSYIENRLVRPENRRD